MKTIVSIHILDTDNRFEEDKVYERVEINCGKVLESVKPEVLNIDETRLCDICLTKHRQDFRSWKHKRYTFAFPEMREQ